MKLFDVVAQLMMAAWKRWGKPLLDDPKTPEDESDVFDPIVEAAVDAALEVAAREAKKKGVPLDAGAMAVEIVQKFPSVSIKDARKKALAFLAKARGK